MFFSFITFQDIENEDGIISFSALKMAVKIKKKQKIFGQFFLVWEVWKIPKICSKRSPVSLLSTVNLRWQYPISSSKNLLGNAKNY